MFNYKKQIEILKLNFKIEIFKIAVINLLGVGGLFTLSYFFLSKFIIPITVGSFLLINFILDVIYDKNISALYHSLEIEFVSVLNYVKTFLSVGFNVYKSLEESIQYCSKHMQNYIGILLSHMDNDKSIYPFVEFSKHFKSRIVEQVMMSLFLMIDNGSNLEYLLRYTPIFHQLEKDNEKNLVKKIEESFNTLNLLPVVGAAVITLIIISGIAGMMGDAFNVF